MIRAFFICVWLGLALLFYAALIEPRQTLMRGVEFGEGDRVVRIALVTDIHIGGPHVSSQRVRNIVARINDASVDMTLLPGDFIDGHTPMSERSFEKRAVIADGIDHFTDLNAPAYASIGNHDVWYGADSVAQHLEAAAVRAFAMRVRNLASFASSELMIRWRVYPARPDLMIAPLMPA